MAALGGHFSNLEIDSEDICALLLQTEECQALTIHLNYLDRIYRREIMIVCDDVTIKSDLASGIIRVCDAEEKFVMHRDETFRSEHRVAMNEGSDLCTVNEALQTDLLIRAAGKAAQKKIWVSR